ncbi:MAG: GNAT family N-acetyltransferase [Thermomicrobiales bacterium]
MTGLREEVIAVATPLTNSAHANAPGGLPLRTERTLLRLAEPADAPELLAFHARNAAHLAPTSPQRPPGFLTLEHWERQIAQEQADFAAGRAVRLLLCPAGEPQRVIGGVNLNSISRGAAQYADLSYALDADAQGQGLITEATRAVIAYAFGPLNLHRVRACYLPTNERSGAVLRRLGFVIEGYARDYLLIDGRWQDQILTGLINPEWRPA